MRFDSTKMSECISGMEHAGIPSELSEKVKIAVFGAGSFGTALAMVSARRGHDVVMYARDPLQVETINTEHRNPRYFSDFVLPGNIRATTSVKEAATGSVFILHCIPAQLTPDFLAENKDDIPPDSILCCTSKGLYLKTKELLHTPMLRALGRPQPIAFLSGPSFAKELMADAPTAVVVASDLLYHAVRVQRLLSSLTFRVYSSQDMVGVQLGGALKNPLAIGAGALEGAGFGINTLAAFVTRSSLELQRLCIAMGGKPGTVSGLSGIGDLMLTAFGSLSRNRRAGARLSKGERLEDIMSDYTVEGVPTAEVAVYFADQCGLELPIFRAVNAFLKGEVDSSEVQARLMNRPLRSEH